MEKKSLKKTFNKITRNNSARHNWPQSLSEITGESKIPECTGKSGRISGISDVGFFGSLISNDVSTYVRTYVRGRWVTSIGIAILQ